MARRIMLFVLVTVTALAAGISMPRQWLEPVFHHGSYYFVLTAFILWAALVIRIFSGRALSFFKLHYPALLLAIVLMMMIFSISPPKFKILADETNLVGTSMAMHANKTVALPVSGFGLEYYVFDYSSAIDQRPLFFPFVLSLFHAALGYSPYNGFKVNFVAGAMALFMMYLLLSRGLSKFYGFLGMLLMAAFPIFVCCVTSGGFETMNLLFVVVTIYTLYRFLEERTVDYAELFFLSLVLLAQCRYESALFLAGIVVALPFLMKEILVRRYRLTTYIIPLLLTPLLWQRRIAFFPPPVQLGVDGPPMLTPHNYAAGHILNNFSKNLFVLSGLDPYYGFLPLVFLAAVIGTYFIVKKWLAGSRVISLPHRVITVYGALCGGLLFLGTSAYIWGVFTLGIDNRLALVFVPFLIAPAAYWICLVTRGRGEYINGLILMLAAVHLLYYWPLAVRQPLMETKSVTYAYDRILRYLYSNYDIGHEHILLISDWTNLYTIHGLGAIGFEDANSQTDEVRVLDEIYYDHVLVTQRYDRTTDRPKKGNQLDADFRLTRLKRLDIGPDFYMVISEAEVLKAGASVSEAQSSR